MPGIDFEAVRSQVSLGQVLDLLGFEVRERKANQVRGVCPVHKPQSPRSRSFSANLEEDVYRCFTCGSSGGVLELWAAVHGISMYEAAEDLCGKMGIDVPRIKRW